MEASIIQKGMRRLSIAIAVLGAIVAVPLIILGFFQHSSEGGSAFIAAAIAVVCTGALIAIVQLLLWVLQGFVGYDEYDER